MLIVVTWAAICLFLATLQKQTVLVAVTIIAGFVQAPLITFTQDVTFQLIDDIPAVVLILGASVRAIFGGRRDGERGKAAAVAFYLAVVVLAALALARSPDLNIGIAQARQVLIPIGLAFAGYVLFRSVYWRGLLLMVAALGLVSATWMIAEEVLQAPLIDPYFYFTKAIGGTVESMRNGLPSPYYSDGIGGETVFRPGGNFFNPPTAGFFLGLGGFALIYAVKSPLKYLGIIPIVLALVFSYARAGMVILLCVTLVYWIWYRLGRFSAAIVSAAVAAYFIQIFVQQGNTASHLTGLAGGVVRGVTTVVGIGFGGGGYQALLEGVPVAGVEESLIGLYVAWMGIGMLAILAGYLITVVRRLITTPRKHSMPYWFVIGFFAAAASSETASALASTALIWMFVGAIVRAKSEVDGILEVRPNRESDRADHVAYMRALNA